jgi:hypothetical protein
LGNKSTFTKSTFNGAPFQGASFFALIFLPSTVINDAFEIACCEVAPDGYTL